MALTVGIDLCDDYTMVYVSGAEAPEYMPTVICREKKNEYWYIGEEAYRKALSGQGVLTDKLVSLMKKEGRSTVGGRTYTSVELCTVFLRMAIETALGEQTIADIDRLCLVLHRPDRLLMDTVSEALAEMGLKKGSFRIASHAEAFMHYVLKGDKELYNNLVGLYDLSEDSFSYYEFRVIRGLSRLNASCEGTDLEEAFHLDVLKTDSGRKLADHIIAECARKLMDKKIFSSVFLTGKGFEDLEWAEEFKEYICRRKRVIYEDGLFARGAEIYAAKELSGANEDILMLCDSRMTSEIGMNVIVAGRQSRLVLAPAGIPWYGYSAHVEFIPYRQDGIEIDIYPSDRHKSRISRTVGLKELELPVRPERCTRISMDLSLIGQSDMEIRLRDMGFGEFFPATGAEIVSEVDF